MKLFEPLESELNAESNQLFRIQSETLHNQFQAQRSKVQRRLQEELEEATGSGGGARGVRRPTTRLLFHGTKEEVHKKILLNGFDRSHAGVNATMYGRGVYFAQSPLYSHRYARPSAITNARFMFLAEVITGEFCQGTKDMASVPLKP